MSFANFNSDKAIKGRLQAALYSMRKKRRLLATSGEAPPVLRPILGGHGLGWIPEGSSTNPVQTPEFTSRALGSSFLYFIGGYSSNNTVPVDSFGNIPVLQDSSFYVPYGTAFQNQAYWKPDGIGGVSHYAELLKTSYISGEVSIGMIEIENADTISGGVVYRNEGQPLESDTITVQGPALLVSAWFGDGGAADHTAVPDSGFESIDSLLSLPPELAVQCCFAVKEIQSTGESTHSVTWSSTPSQGAAIYLYAVTKSGGG